jgi:ferrochelatase
MTHPIDSVLLIGFGGPTAPDEIRPFLANVIRGRQVSEERQEAVARHYEEIGGRSPYNELTLRQAGALQTRLRETGLPLPVFVGMRNWRPFLADTIREMGAAGLRRAAGIILAPHRSQTSWERYQADVERGREAIGGQGPEVVYPPAWHADPLFIEAMAQRIEAASELRRGAWPAELPLVFTAHSIPVSMAATSRYGEEVRESAAAVSVLLGARRWSIAYQSASGDGRIPWLGPDVNEAIRLLAGEGVSRVVLAPVGFLCDHFEVLYDLDIEARRTASAADVQLVRSGTVGTHPLFIQMLTGLVRELANE